MDLLFKNLKGFKNSYALFLNTDTKSKKLRMARPRGGLLGCSLFSGSFNN